MIGSFECEFDTRIQTVWLFINYICMRIALETLYGLLFLLYAISLQEDLRRQVENL